MIITPSKQDDVTISAPKARKFLVQGNSLDPHEWRTDLCTDSTATPAKLSCD
jgi:hypothetical protein